MHRSYEKGEVHVCPECGKTFPLKAYLHQHMRVHKEAAYKLVTYHKFMILIRLCVLKSDHSLFKVLHFW